MIKTLFIILFVLLQINGFAQNINDWNINNNLTLISEVEKKVALVIGNTYYNNESWNLKNPTNDAKLIYKTLKKLNFDVEIKEDLNREQFKDEIKKYKSKLDNYDFGILYYAGHAIQDGNGNSYLMPIDFTFEKKTENEGFNVSELISYFDYSENKCLIIIDACRNDGNNGLPKPNIQDPLNVKLGYSTSFGKTASDNSDLNNSIYTKFLSDMLLVPENTIENILYSTAMQVLFKTKEQQQPTSYFGIYLNKIKINSSY
tara:strand:- start:66 stop:842 length:777 start_codon:yes stop_codon:yes gene_type:complete